MQITYIYPKGFHLAGLSRFTAEFNHNNNNYDYTYLFDHTKPIKPKNFEYLHSKIN